MLVSKRSSRELLGNVGDLRGSDRGGGGKEGGKSDDRHCHEMSGSTSRVRAGERRMQRRGRKGSMSVADDLNGRSHT